MTDDEADPGFGTVALHAPATRGDLERALRNLNLADLEMREALLLMGARLVTLTDELTRRLDGVEPEPARPGTPAPPPTETLEVTVMRNLGSVLGQIRLADVAQRSRISLDTGPDKYAVEPSDPPCDEVLHLCQARCCTFNFALSSRDLDEGVIRWDHGQPYLIRQRASDGYCVHNDPGSHGCTVHGHRPRVCRVYDCRTDRRVWLDFARRVPAPLEDAHVVPPEPPLTELDLVDRLHARTAAITAERTAMAGGYADPGPTRGPKP